MICALLISLTQPEPKGADVDSILRREVAKVRGVSWGKFESGIDSERLAMPRGSKTQWWKVEGRTLAGEKTSVHLSLQPSEELAHRQWILTGPSLYVEESRLGPFNTPLGANSRTTRSRNIEVQASRWRLEVRSTATSLSDSEVLCRNILGRVLGLQTRSLDKVQRVAPEGGVLVNLDKHAALRGWRLIKVSGGYREYLVGKESLGFALGTYAVRTGGDWKWLRPHFEVRTALDRSGRATRSRKRIPIQIGDFAVIVGDAWYVPKAALADLSD